MASSRAGSLPHLIFVAPKIHCGSEPARDRAASLNGYLWLERTDKDGRIHPRIIQADIPVHMRPGRPPGGANLADHTATRHLLPDLHINLRHVAEHADKALPMVDKHRVAIKE